MSEEKDIKNNEQKKRGRPRKETPQQINEQKEVLNMSVKPEPEKPITVEKVQTSLTNLYNKLLFGKTEEMTAFGAKGEAWMGSLLNFNQYNPFLQNQRLKMLNSLPGDMDMETLSKALADPSGSESSLRKQGWSLASSQFLYYKILRLAADIPKFKYYKTPELFDSIDFYKKKEFVNEDCFVDEWLKKFDVVNTFKKVSLEVKREGKPTYLLRNSITNNPGDKKGVNFATFQKLPTEWVKLTGIGEHGYIASLNMLLFMNPAFSLDQYPEFISDIWKALTESGAIYENPDYNVKGKKNNSEKYKIDLNLLRKFSYNYENNGSKETLFGNISITKNGLKNISYAYWIQLPQDVCYTFCSDNSNAWAMPDTSGLFLGLRELTDYDTLAGLIQSTPLTALLTAEAECVNNPNPGQNQTVLAAETIAGFQEKFNTSTSTNLESFFAPFKNFKLLTLPNVPNSSDITSNATKNFISRAGLSGLIPATDKPSVAQIKGSQLVEEAACDFVTKQLESVLNFIVNDLIGCKYKWNIHIWGNIFTYSDEVKSAKELFIAGGTFALPKLASAYNMSLRDVSAVQCYIESLGLYDKFKTVTQAQQNKNNNTNQNGEEKQSGAGRPAIDASEVENDNTAASKESGLDTADVRDFEFNGKCVLCGKDSDEPLCEECKELYMEE